MKTEERSKSIAATYVEYQGLWATEEEGILYTGKSLKCTKQQVIISVTWLNHAFHAHKGRRGTIAITHQCLERAVGEVQLCCGCRIPVGKSSFELARQHRPLKTQEKKERV